MSEARAGHRTGFFHARVRRQGKRRARVPLAFVPISKESEVMPFEKGQSGNPAGRPRGSRSRATMALQDMLERDAESIARAAINLAKHGNIAALRICMDRLLPPRRHEPVTLDLPALDKVADTVAATNSNHYNYSNTAMFCRRSLSISPQSHAPQSPFQQTGEARASTFTRRLRTAWNSVHPSAGMATPSSSTARSRLALLAAGGSRKSRRAPARPRPGSATGRRMNL